MSTAPNPPTQPTAIALGTIIDGMSTVMAGLLALRETITNPQESAQAIDPKDPRNKHTIGGLEKFTPRGVEVCYRLFDQGMSRYAVAQAMGISFGAATHRYDAWQKAGGQNRPKKPLD